MTASIMDDLAAVVARDYSTDGPHAINADLDLAQSEDLAHALEKLDLVLLVRAGTLMVARDYVEAAAELGESVVDDAGDYWTARGGGMDPR